MLLLYVTFFIVAQAMAFNLPNAVASSRTKQPSLMVVTDADNNIGNVRREEAMVFRSVLTVDNLVTSSSTSTAVERKIHEINKRTHHLTDDNETDDDHFQKWILKLFNDSENTRSHVCKCLVRSAGLSEEESYLKMMHAHKHGEAIIGEYFWEHAAFYKEVLVESGLVCDIFPVEEEL